MLPTGNAFPDFRLLNQDGTPKTLRDYAGKWLVVFVYPKDDTPGCTIESKAFSAARAEFEKRGAIVVGLSADDVASHKAFCGKFGLVVELLADPEAKLLSTLGVKQSEWKGTLYWDRTTFVVDPTGKLAKTYLGVRPDGHEAQVLADLTALQSPKL